MISLTKLLTDQPADGDRLRYASHSHRQKSGALQGRGPVVVWNCTRACNLQCRHCYADAGVKKHDNELSTQEAEQFIDDLAHIKSPVLLFSGGEPLLRKDVFHLARYAAAAGIRPVISTNGTLISRDVAKRIKKSGIGYVGVSLDGMEGRNDAFRGCRGAFNQTLEGIRNCREAGQKVGLRFTICQYTREDLEAVFDLVRRENIPRLCLYHLVAAGRGGSGKSDDLTMEEKRKTMDLIIEKTLEFHAGGLTTEILTVDNHADGIYVYQKLKKKDPERAQRALQLLKNNGGNRSGIAIGCVDWKGDVHPDQFTRSITLGNVRERHFSEIWTDTVANPVLTKLRDRKNHLKGRCRCCLWLGLCNGNLRARAMAETGDLWASDSGCYLTDEEIR